MTGYFKITESLPAEFGMYGLLETIAGIFHSLNLAVAAAGQKVQFSGGRKFVGMQNFYRLPVL